MKENGKKEKQKKRIRDSVTAWTLFAVLCVTLCVLYATWQIMKYEEGVIGIYARQQDAYVQLVLDQININKDNKSEEAILDIIGTLDSSTNKYWTLSHDETLIFVKDVTETNRYKGFTTKTYYYSDTAQEFLEGLTVNKVTHDKILINEQEYITSGVKFQYQGGNYQICLLTNPEVVLEQNEYLSARVNLSVMIAAVLVTFLITVISMGRAVAKRNMLLEAERRNNIRLNHMVEQLNEELNREDAYDVRKSVFHMAYLPDLYKKLQSRGLAPVTFMALEYDNGAERDFFLRDAFLLLDKKIMRFGDATDKRLVLVLVQQTEEQAFKAIEWILSPALRVNTAFCVEDVENTPYVQIADRLLGGITKDEN